MRVGHGPRTRIRAPYGTPEFQLEYEAAIAGRKPDGRKKEEAKTLRWLWDRYCESSKWNGLSPATRRQRENIMKHVLERAGDMPFARLSAATVRKGMEDRQKTPSQANNFLNTLNGLCAWAVKNDHMKTNPAEAVETLRRPKTGGFPLWTEEDVAKYEAFWPLGTRQRLAFAVHLYTGLRRGDAVRLGRQHFRKGTIHIQAEKNGAELTVPVHPGLIDAINACRPSGLHILEQKNGKPWGSKESYGNTFHDWALEAGIVDKGQPKNSHGLRKCAATRVADAGASEREMMALFGWTDPSMARVYTEAANAKRLALQAASKVEGFVQSTVELFPEEERSLKI